MASVTLNEILNEIKKNNLGISIWFDTDETKVMFEDGLDLSTLKLPDGVEIENGILTYDEDDYEIIPYSDQDRITLDKSSFNFDLLSFFQGKIVDIIEKARKNPSDADKVDVQNAKILKEDEELYNLLMQLSSILGDESIGKKGTKSDEILDLYCKVGDGGNLKRTNFRINKKDLDTFKKIIGDIEKHLGVEFVIPNEIYQSVANNVLPNEPTLLAPEPKTLAESEAEYEERLEKHYGSKTDVDGLNGVREPYPHEKTDYKKDPTKYISDDDVAKHNYPSGYYNEYFQSKVSTARKNQPAPFRRFRTSHDPAAREKLKDKLARLHEGLKNNLTVPKVVVGIGLFGIAGVVIKMAPKLLSALGTILGSGIVNGIGVTSGIGLATGSGIVLILTALIVAGVAGLVIKAIRDKKIKKGQPGGPTVLSTDETLEKLNAAIKEKEATDALVKIEELLLDAIKGKKAGTYDKNAMVQSIIDAEGIITQDQKNNLLSEISKLDTLSKDDLDKEETKHTDALKNLLEAQKKQIAGIQDIIQQVKDLGGLQGGLSHA